MTVAERVPMRHSWLVKEALRDPSRLFNPEPQCYCKLCDLPTPRSEWEPHVAKHAAQFGLSVVKQAAANPLYEDVLATIRDSLALRGDGEAFETTLPTVLASAIVEYVQEGSAGDPLFCEDCQT